MDGPYTEQKREQEETDESKFDDIRYIDDPCIEEERTQEEVDESQFADVSYTDGPYSEDRSKQGEIAKSKLYDFSARDGPYNEEKRKQEEEEETSKSDDIREIDGLSNVDKRNQEEVNATISEQSDVPHLKISTLHQTTTKVQEPDTREKQTQRVIHERPSLRIKCQRPTPNSTWLLFASCGMVAFLSIGLAISFGSVYLDIMETFNTSRPLAALVPSLSNGIGFGLGIVTGPVINRMGVAQALIIGSLLMTTGCIASFFVQSIYILYVTFCVFTGTGVSLTYLASNVIVASTFYRIRQRILPVFSVLGSMGSAVFPLLLRRLVDVYGLRGMFLIVGGLCLQVLIAGFIAAIFQAHKEVKAKKKLLAKEMTACNPGVLVNKSFGVDFEESNNKSSENIAYNDEGDIGIECSIEGNNGTECSIEGDNGKRCNNEGHDDIRCSNENSNGIRCNNSIVNYYVHNNGDVGYTQCNKMKANGTNVTSDDLVIEAIESGICHNSVNNNRDCFKSNQDRSELNNLATSTYDVHNTADFPAILKISVITDNNHNECSTRNGCGAHGDCQKDKETSQTSPTTTTSIVENDKPTRKNSIWAEMFQPDLYRNRFYLVTCLFGMSVFLTVSTPMIFITDIAREVGLSVDQGTMLLSVLFFLTLAGRVLLAVVQIVWGFFPLYVHSIFLLGTALSLLCFTFIGYVDSENIYSAYLALCAIYGLFFGIMSTCVGITCLELVSMHQYAAALGNQFFLGGLFGAINGPLGGTIKDMTGSYNPMCYFGFAQGILASIVIGVAGLLLRRKQKKHVESRNDNTHPCPL